MISVQVELRQSLEVKASPQQAFALVSDIYRSGMHFPCVASLTEVDGAGRWRWQLDERGFGPVKFRPCYESIYTSDEAALCVAWAPPPVGAGDMESSGSWLVESCAVGARLTFVACTVAHIPAPAIMRGMVEAFTKEELLRMKAEYLDAIAKTLNSLDGSEDGGRSE